MRDLPTAPTSASDDISSLLGDVGGDQSAQFPWADTPMSSLPSSLWSVEQDFDLDAFNGIITNMMAPPESVEPDCNLVGFEEYGQQTLARDARTEWYTWIPNPSVSEQSVLPRYPPYETKDESTKGTNFDEAYRGSLRKRLRTERPSDSLPSTDFLNLCVRAYFTHFQPVFPILHMPTFRPSQENALLLLSICSVGSISLGGSAAREQGVKIFENLNKAILASWEWHLARGGAEAMAMIQAATIGQTFAVLSGEARHLALAESFHGTVIAWARRCKLFDVPSPSPPPGKMKPFRDDDLETSWRAWVRGEERMRVVSGLHVHDAEISALVHQEPLLGHGFTSIPPLAPEKLFNAPSATHWDSMRSSLSIGLLPNLTSELADERPESNKSAFMAYCCLEGINALTCRSTKPAVVSNTLLSHLEERLLAWCKEYQALWKTPQREAFQTRILLCSTYLALLVDLDVIERAMGREGPEDAEKASPTAKAWATSPQALRCLMYANVILKGISDIRIGDEAAIHTPRAAFQAGLIFLCYASFGFGTGQVNATSELEAIMDETFIPASDHMEAFSLAQPMTARSRSRHAIDALQRVGRWGLASRLATLLTHLAEREDAHV